VYIGLHQVIGDTTGKRKDINKLHRLTERDSRLAHYFALLWGWGLLLGYFSGAKSDIIFLLSNPDYLQGRWNFASISRSFRYLTRDRQTTDDSATKTEGSHTASLINTESELGGCGHAAFPKFCVHRPTILPSPHLWPS